MIVSISARKKSGKSTVANLLLEKGYKKASFATALKEYVSKLYNWNITDLESQTGKEENLNPCALWSLDACKKLEKIANIDLQFRGEVCFKTRREALQYIGTEVLRHRDKYFHVKEFKKRFSSGGNFVCDDTRFPNEIETIKSMNGLCMFIIRPYFYEYSNHESEISLTRHNFDNVLVNDKGFDDLISTAKEFLFGKCKFSKQELLENLKNTNCDIHTCANKFNCSEKEFVSFCKKHLLWIGDYSINHDFFSEVNDQTKYWANRIKLSYNGYINAPKEFYNLVGGKSPEFCSPFMFEDLKLFNYAF